MPNPATSTGTWYENENVGLLVEETDVGAEYSIYEYAGDEWRRRYTMPEGQALALRELLFEPTHDA